MLAARRRKENPRSKGTSSFELNVKFFYMPENENNRRLPARKIWLAFVAFLIFLGAYLGIESLFEWLPFDLSDKEKLRVAQGVGTVFWFTAALFITRAQKRFLWQGWLTRRTEVAPPKLLIEITNAVIWFSIALVVAAFVFDLPVTGFVTASGVVVAVIGFAIRDLIADVFTGIFMGLEKPINVGDWVQLLDEDPGEVTEISWRVTRLVTENGITIIVPNRLLATQQFSNFHLPKKYFREKFNITLGFNVTSYQAERILLSAISQVSECMAVPKKPSVRIQDYTERGVEWEVRFWVPNFPKRSSLLYQVQRNVMRNLHYSGVKVPRERIELLNSARRKNLYDGIADDVAFMKSIHILSCLENDEIIDLLAGMRRMVAQAGAPVVRQDDEGTSLFIIKEGILNVTIHSEEGDEVAVGKLIPGTFFGEMSLLTGAARSATVTPEVDSLLFEITKSQLEPMLKSRVELVERLSAALADRQMTNLQSLKDKSVEETESQRSSLASEFMGRIHAFFGMRRGKK